MDEQLRKRLEEAAEEYADKHGFRVPYDGSNNFYDETDVKASKDGFLAGAEHGYKEAIAQAKEWLKENAHDYSFSNVGCDALLSDFERNMNKLWEKEMTNKESRYGKD